MPDRPLLRLLARLGEVREHEPLARHTTFGVGGPADVYARIASREGLSQAVRAVRDAGEACFVLGSGSNVVVSDDGLRGVVIENRTRATDEPELNDGGVRLAAESGAPLAKLARDLCRRGLAGLEWAAGIPGTVGGAVVYNAGAYGGCLADTLDAVEVVEQDHVPRVLAAGELGLSYRGSGFTRGLLQDRVVTRAWFLLQPADPGTLLAQVARFDDRRRATQPHGRSAGSMFKNPPGKPAWWYIDQVGLRGCRIGGAQVSELHANFFVNAGGATAAEVHRLTRLAQGRVHEQFNVDLETEVRFVGRGWPDG